jgi:signal transduction histidine kinase
MRVLIVDDDQIDRMAICRDLVRRMPDVKLIQVESGADAITALREQSFDCMFLDYLMPDMDGIDVLKKIYNHETDLAPMPVVMLTGHGNEAIMADALRLGAQDYLMKDNLTPDRLSIAMAKACEVYQLKQERRGIEEQLRQAQKMEAIGHLTSGIAHDFNNLLTVIFGNTRLMKKRLDPEVETLNREDLLRKTEAIDTAAKKGAEMVRRLMIFARQRPLEQREVDLNSVVQSAADLLRESLSERIKINVDLAAQSRPVKIDVGPFENSLINMAVNARDAMPGGGTLTMRTEDVTLGPDNSNALSGQFVRISVSDTGIGMSEDIKSRVFEPFFTTKSVGEGTGLGLSMAHSFIRQSGGYIDVESAPGMGSTFNIYLPLAHEGVYETGMKQKISKVK